MPGPRQLDEISERLGRLDGRFDGIERYMHEREHNISNLTQKLDAISVQFSKEIATAKAEVSTSLERVEARIQTIDERVTVIERGRERESGARGLAVWLLQSPMLAWIAAAAVAIAAWWKAPR